MDTTRTPAGDELQVRCAAFLADPGNWHDGSERVEHVETHISHVFLGRRFAYKMKKAVRLPYLDFSTLEKRLHYCRRELEINARFSARLYLGLSWIARRGAGDALVLVDGEGREPPADPAAAARVVEWLVRMRRFDADAILATVVARDGVSASLARELARMAAAAHRAAAVRHPPSGRDILAATIERQLRGSFATHAATLGDDAAELLARMEALLARHGRRLDARVDSGHVRRCHGDMHLGNIVLLDGRPTLFDAIEFSEDIATVDILYDLAFLLMDLVHAGHAAAANRVLNAWLADLDDEDNHATVGTVGLMVGLRAAIRAMVALDLADQRPEAERAAAHRRARDYLDTALAATRPPRPRLVAIGGLSGSGKTTLAAALAPLLAPGPGAVHLRSDVERKRMFGHDELQRLPPACYTPEVSARVYRRLQHRAGVVLAGGWPVVVDAVYARPQERDAIARVAEAAGAEFVGLWLDAPADELLRRVGARHGDASDATPEVVRSQLRLQTGPLAWRRIDATGSPQAVRDRALAALASEGAGQGSDDRS